MIVVALFPNYTDENKYTVQECDATDDAIKIFSRHNNDLTLVV